MPLAGVAGLSESWESEGVGGAAVAGRQCTVAGGVGISVASERAGATEGPGGEWALDGSWGGWLGDTGGAHVIAYSVSRAGGWVGDGLSATVILGKALTTG